MIIPYLVKALCSVSMVIWSVLLIAPIVYFFACLAKRKEYFWAIMILFFVRVSAIHYNDVVIMHTQGNAADK